MAEGSTVLAGDQGLDVAAHGARHPVGSQGWGLWQQRHPGGLEHHLVPLVVGGLDGGVGGGGGLDSDNLAVGDVMRLGGGEDAGAVVSAGGGGGVLKEVLSLITDRALLSRVMPLEHRPGALRNRREFLVGDHHMPDPIM